MSKNNVKIDELIEAAENHIIWQIGISNYREALKKPIPKEKGYRR